MGWSGCSSFVYGLVCPVTKCVRYVGSTTDPKTRYAQHLRKGVNPAVQRWLDRLKKRGLAPTMIILEVEPYGKHSSENEWIRHYRKRLGRHLLNHFDLPWDDLRQKRFKASHLERAEKTWRVRLSQDQHDKADAVRAELGLSKKELTERAIAHFVASYARKKKNRKSDKNLVPSY